MNLAKNARVSKISTIGVAGCLSSHRVPNGSYYTDGVVRTNFGFVRVYAESSFWSLEFIWNGNSYNFGARCQELLSDLVLTRRATKFAKEVVKKTLDERL